MNLNYQQKMQAILALGEASVVMRKPDDWYVAQSGVDVKAGSVLEGRYGNGVHPEAAIHDHWDQLTQLKDGEYVVVFTTDDHGTKRRHVRWNGFMWEDVPSSQSK